MTDIPTIARRIREACHVGWPWNLSTMLPPEIIRSAMQMLAGSGLGPSTLLVNGFEYEIARICECRHALATITGTAALHTALHAVGVRPGDMVAVPSVGYIAAANAVTYCGARPLFYDVLPTDGMWTQTEPPVTKPPGVRAVLAVHLHGYAADLSRLAAWCRDVDLPLVVDACQAVLTSYDGHAAASMGDVAAISFAANKCLSTGQGGALVTSRDDIAAAARQFIGVGSVPDPADPTGRDFIEIGQNYRMATSSAVIGAAQLPYLSNMWHVRRRQYWSWSEALHDQDVATPVLPRQNVEANYWTMPIMMATRERRDELCGHLAMLGVPHRLPGRPVPLTRAYRTPEYTADEWAGATAFCERTILLPCS